MSSVTSDNLKLLPVEYEAEWLSEPAETKTYLVDADQHGCRLDQFLAERIPEYSRSYLQNLIETGYVKLNAQLIKTSSKKIIVGQTVAIELVPPPETQAFQPDPIDLNIIYEDTDVLVLNKPAGLVVHPAAGNWRGTILNGLLAQYPASASLPRAGIVHRLDKDTSGLMVVGKTLQAMTALSRAIAKRTVQRQYLAICHGAIKVGTHHVDAPIGRDPISRVKMAIQTSGKAAQTTIHALQSGVNPDTGAIVSGLHCILQTGRTHQIRVHSAYLGHPLVADALYGGRSCRFIQRQALHATCLSFVHPNSEQRLHFKGDPPIDFIAAWQSFFKLPIPALDE